MFTFFILDLRLNVLDSIRRFDFESDRLASERLHEDLHTTTKTQHQVKGRFLLDVVVRKCATVLKLLAGENQSLLIRWDAFLVLDLGSAKPKLVAQKSR